jgi:hypothetical protein
MTLFLKRSTKPYRAHIKLATSSDEALIFQDLCCSSTSVLRPHRCSANADVVCARCWYCSIL